MAAMVAPSGMPTPLTGIPTARPKVEPTVITGLPTTVVEETVALL